jgi:alpha-L-fucosidase
VSAQTPNADDIIWQKSVQKYDAPRGQYLEKVDGENQHGKFRPTWDSLSSYQVPDWWRDLKFGIFIHWGVYSVPAYGSEWYPRDMYQQSKREFKHHIETYGPQTKFGYKDFIPGFRAEKFDADAWAKLFREAGAKYVIPVAEHHDGFPMYASDLTDWCAGKMGPKRDVIGELAQAIRKEGLHFGASSHRAEHYFFFNGGRAFNSDVQDPKYASLYGPAHVGVAGPNWSGNPDKAYLDDWLARSTEIVEKYHPDIMYFDWWIGQKAFESHLQRFISFYYNDAAKRNTTVVMHYKEKAVPEGAAVLDVERGQLEQIRPLPWQTDTSISNQSWGYVENDTYKSPESIVWLLADVVSKNGSLLLNVGPRSDGTIPEPAQLLFHNIGAWLQINGEAIYGTRPWTKFGEGPTKVVGGAFHESSALIFTSHDFRFTTKGKNLYAISLGWPEDGQWTIHSLATGNQFNVVDVALLGSEEKLKWSQNAEGLTIELPKSAPGKYAYSFRITPKE